MAEQVVKNVGGQAKGRVSTGKSAKMTAARAMPAKPTMTRAAMTRATMTRAAPAKAKTAKATTAKAKTAKATTAKAKTAKASVARQAATKAAARWRPQERAEFVVAQLGGPRAAARVLGVAPSQPTRWVQGDAVPGPEAGRAIADLDHVFAVALQVWEPEIARDWMLTGNAYLDGARPVDVVRMRGSAEVVQALRAEAAGAYA